MLKPYNYIAFDFETTGLDVKKDEAIQIGIVQFDSEGNITDRYSSLIKPNKPIKELKEIVRFLTGFSLSALETAPPIDQILPDIQKFFTENTVVVGHNIGFDVAFLNKYMSFQPEVMIDTYPLSRQLFPYIPSYALDVIHSRLIKNKQLQPTATGNNAHDALYDSHMSYDLFMSMVKHINNIRHKNIIVDYAIENSDSLFTKIIQRTQKNYKFDGKKLFLPPLKKSSLGNKKVTALQTFDLPEERFNTLDASALCLIDLLKSIDRSKHNWIVATSHKSKSHLVEGVLSSLHLSHGSFHDQVIFDEDRVDRFLHKEQFTASEVGFLIKYYTHHEASHGSMDINTIDEYRIFSALTKRKEKKRQSITVTSHQHLTESADKVDPTDRVLYLDHGWWYKTYSNLVKKPLDPYYILNYIEQLEYLYELIGNIEVSTLLEEFQQHYSILLGVISSEINQYFVGYSERYRDMDFMLDDPRFPKTKASFPRFMNSLSTLAGLLSDQEFTRLKEYLEQLNQYLGGLCRVEKKMYNGDKRYYVFHQREQFVDYPDFLESLPEANYYFVDTVTSTKPGLCKLPHSANPSPRAIPTLHPLIKAKQLIEHIKKAGSTTHCMILSSSKQQSQELFNHMIEEKLHETYTIVAENITGGVGKGVFHATQSTKPVIVLGGYSFYLALLVKKFAFSRLYLYHIYGGMKRQIITDMLWYIS